MTCLQPDAPCTKHDAQLRAFPILIVTPVALCSLREVPVLCGSNLFGNCAPIGKVNRMSNPRKPDLEQLEDCVTMTATIIDAAVAWYHSPHDVQKAQTLSKAIKALLDWEAEWEETYTVCQPASD